MKTITGECGIAKVFTENIDESAEDQIKLMMNQEFIEGEQVRIMPDVHAGKGSTIGTTMTIRNRKIVPNLVGVDIGCGILCTEIKGVDFRRWKNLDQVISREVPSGYQVRKNPVGELLDRSLLSFEVKNLNRIHLSKGTLGGGNHFIEVTEGSSGSLYLLIHSGSRNLGVQVATHHQKIAINYLESNVKAVSETIARLKFGKRAKDIQEELKQLVPKQFNPNLAYLEGDLLDDYLNDMQVCQKFAVENRLTMAATIVREMGWEVHSQFDSMHNYIDLKKGILRKGATDASKGTKLVIPLNMRDGAILAIGLGNDDWNYSAPHGAGRVMSRTKAKEVIDFEKFQESMKGVYSTSVVKGTVDEAPFAYKKAKSIIDNIQETVEIIEVVKPLYNFKAH